MIKTGIINLSKQLVKASEIMQNFLQKSPAPPSFIPLRELSNYCARRLLEADNSFERFLCFYLYSLIDSIFSNLGGDTPYDEQLQQVREKFYAKLSHFLLELGNAIVAEDKNSTIDYLISSVDEYINNIVLLNRSP